MGDIARRLYNPFEQGQLIDPQAEGFDAAFARTQVLLRSAQPIFEAGFRAEGALAFADVLLPTAKGWRMVEVKSSASVKDYHRDDAAAQSFLARASGVPLQSIAVAHIDSGWSYPGGGDYRGLLMEVDVTADALGRDHEVRSWIASAQAVMALEKAPPIATGGQCHARPMSAASSLTAKARSHRRNTPSTGCRAPATRSRHTSRSTASANCATCRTICSTPRSSA
ncbi:hypothetical protein [Diaphorobacter sp. MNS-0]|uniref:hypothetical protein n=1 Tax=Diaphorobacter sp. MNS-0 TaxID=2866628 RepID=UPI002107EB33|nr:hypothetical protein [Diaphorobacter sp. MNS-0]